MLYQHPIYKATLHALTATVWYAHLIKVREIE